MTYHKPFTAEQLDELDRGYRNTYWACLDPETRGRLIAQARAEIRLREECGRLAVAADKATCAYEALLAEDPAARAKRELGEWLAENYQHRSVKLQESGGRFRVHLIRGGYDNVTGPWCATEHEAITAALKTAKESGR